MDATSRRLNVARTHDMTVNAPTITVLIPGPLRKYCGDAGQLALQSPTLRALLNDLEQKFPELYRSVCDDSGAVRRHINLFVNTDHMRDRQGLDTPLAAGDEVTIMPAVSGG